MGRGLWNKDKGYFSGKEPLSNDEVPSEHWAYEVQNNRMACAENILWQSIIQSLRGDMARLVWHMGPNAFVDDILTKLETQYGSLEVAKGSTEQQTPSSAIEEQHRQFTNLKSLVANNKRNVNGSNTTQKKTLPHWAYSHGPQVDSKTTSYFCT